MKPRVLALLGSLLAVVATPVLAHHSFAAEYDNTQPVKVTGVLTRVFSQGLEEGEPVTRLPLPGRGEDPYDDTAEREYRHHGGRQK